MSLVLEKKYRPSGTAFGTWYEQRVPQRNVSGACPPSLLLPHSIAAAEWAGFHCKTSPTSHFSKGGVHHGAMALVPGLPSCMGEAAGVGAAFFTPRGRQPREAVQGALCEPPIQRGNCCRALFCDEVTRGTIVCNARGPGTGLRSLEESQRRIIGSLAVMSSRSACTGVQALMPVKRIKGL